MSRSLLKKAILLPLAAAGTWLVYSRFVIDHEVPLADAIPAQRKVFKARSGAHLNYYFDTAGTGRPIVLIHSVNAAASAYEMGPLFQQFRGSRPVYALDLPGYGFSDRLDRSYTPQYFAEAILSFLESQVGAPADVVALSLGCEFAARAALAMPQLFHSLVLISPSGLGTRESTRATQRAEAEDRADARYNTLSKPLWGRALFDIIASRRSIAWFLAKSFVGPISDGYVDYAYATSHQPGAEHVPLHFISGKLFTPDIRTRFYGRLSMPTLIVYDRDYYSNFDALPELLASNSNVSEARVVPSLGLPQFEKPAETTAVMHAFWAEHD